MPAAIVMHSKGEPMDQKTLLQLVKMHSTPLVVMDHKVLRKNYAQFRKHLPRV